MSHGLDEVQSGKVGVCLTVWMRYCQGRSERVGWLVECCFTSRETVGLLGAGAQDVHLDFHTGHELYKSYLTVGL